MNLTINRRLLNRMLALWLTPSEANLKLSYFWWNYVRALILYYWTDRSIFDNLNDTKRITSEKRWIQQGFYSTCCTYDSFSLSLYEM